MFRLMYLCYTLHSSILLLCYLLCRLESEVIQKICSRIFLYLEFSSNISKELVGIESRVSEMLDLYLDESSGGVRFVGICGMGGSGKTTLSEEIYKRIFGNFEASCFIYNVREETEKKRSSFFTNTTSF